MKKSAIYCLLVILFSCSQNQGIVIEKYKPQYHFSPPSDWMNDPNGMFFHEGKYHLFYQYYPDSTVWGPMHWGHATSIDMMKWEHKPIALYPDTLGYIFSGSAVVDYSNTSGLGTLENPPIVAIYTYHNPDLLDNGRLDFQYQGIAYSLDEGASWMKYEGNPVLENQGSIDFRDPKVMWDKSAQKWVMTLAVWDHVSFYSSADLINWKFESDFGTNWGVHKGVWECPDLFELRVEGSDESKWVLLVSINPGGPQGGSATQYFIGDFDGSRFKLDSAFAYTIPTDQEIFPEGELFEDFETGYQKWEVAGTAFSDTPADGVIGNQNFITGFQGKYLANSYGGSDKLEGTLTSQSFLVTKPFINFKLGGGNDGSGAYMALLVDGKEVKRAFGRNGEKLEGQCWDVSEYIGREAKISIVDSGKSIWGHINVDQITFSDMGVTPEKGNAKWIDYGADNYAGVTWSGIPQSDARRLFLGWMSNWQYAQVVPTKNWRSAMTLPRELKLKRVNGELILASEPVDEIAKYSEKLDVSSEDGNYSIDSLARISINEVAEDITLMLKNHLGEYVSITIDSELITIDRSMSGVSDFSADFAAVHTVDNFLDEIRSIDLYIDASSIEVFINDGELVMTELIFPTEPYSVLIIDKDADVALYKMKSVWN